MEEKYVWFLENSETFNTDNTITSDLKNKCYD